MKIPTNRIVVRFLRFIAVCLSLNFCGNHASATVLYWDNNGTSTPSGGIWDTTTKNWATSSTLTASTVVWNTADAAVFCAGSTSAGTIIVTVNTANLACGGFFNNGVAGSSCNLTLAGSGSLSLNSGLQGIYTSSGVSSTVNIPITGAGGLEPEGSGFLNLYANNGYAGGTTLGNGTTFVQFNNNNAFSTGTIFVYNGSSSLAPLLAVGGAPLTLANTFVVTNGGGGINFASANSTPVTCTGNWDLQGNLALKNNGNLTAPLTLSGVISDYAGLTTSGNNEGAIVLSGANTYSGPTTVTSGTLMVANPSALGESATMVAAGGTAQLDLNGTAGMSAAITLNGVGTNSIGAMINSNLNSTASIQGNVVAAGTVTAAGTGITAPATISVSGGGGSGATAVPSLGVTSATFTITAGTQKYSAVPTVTISGGGGVGAAATASLAGTSPSVISTTITVTSPGYGFTSAPTITFSGGTKSGSGTAPSGTANATHFILTGVRITSGGSGYTSAPTLTLSSGTGTAAAQLSGVNLATASSIGGPGNTTINGVVSGTGSSGLTKVGTGTLTLAAVNTYSGTTTVSGGKLVGVAGGSCASSAVDVQTGGNTLGISITDNTQQWTCAGLTNDDNTATLDFNFGSFVAPSTTVAPLNVNGTVAFTGTPTVTVEAGSLPSGPGTYPLMTWTSLSGTPPASVTLPPHASGNLSISNTTLVLNITANTGPLTWATSGSGAWDINTSQNWDDTTASPAYYLQTAISGDSVVFSDTYISAPTTVTLNTTVTPGTVTVNNSANNYMISGTGGMAGSTGLSKEGSAVLTLVCSNNYSGGTTISAGTLQLGDGVANNGSVAGNIVDNASLVFANFNPQTNSGAISGTGFLTVSGPGTLALSGVNTFSGPITNSAGVIIAGAGLLGGGSYAADIVNNGTFTDNSSASQTWSGIISGTGTLVQSGPGTLTLSGINTYSGATTINGGMLAIGGTGQLGSGTYSANIADGGTLNYSSAASQTLSGVISGSGSLANSGSGTLTLSGANTYTGGTTNNGTLIVSSIADSGTSGINASTNGLVLNGGTFTYNGAASVTTARAIYASANNATLNLADGNLTVNAEVWNANTVAFAKTGGGTLTLGGSVDNHSLGLIVNGGGVILAKPSGSTGHAVGGNNLVLNNNGTWAQLLAGGNNAEIYSGGSVVVNSGTYIDFNSQGDTFTALTLAGNGNGSGALINSAASTTSSLTNSGGVILSANTTIGGSGNIWLDGIVQGAYSLTYVGSGVLTLNSNNIYSGATVISSGTLALGPNGSINSTPGISIGAGATFDVSGLSTAPTLASSVTLGNSSSPAIINGSLKAGSATASLTYVAGAPSFTIDNGTLTLASTTIFNINNTGSTLAHGSYNIISAGTGGSVAGTVPSVTVNGSGIATGEQALLKISGNQLNLVVDAAPTITNTVVTENVTTGLIWKIAITNLASAAGWGDPDGDTVTLGSVGPASFNGTNVTSDANYIYYNGAVAVADHFSYTVTDGALTNSGTVNLTPVSQPGPTINAPSVNGNGNPAFGGNGIPNYVYGVESATSLTGPWVESGNVTAGATGSWSFTDLTQTNPPTIFYRIYYPDNPSNPPQ